jgi:hypothetical protein
MSKPLPQTASQRQATYRAKAQLKAVDLTAKTRALLGELHKRTGLKLDTLVQRALVVLTYQLAQEADLGRSQKTRPGTGTVATPPDPNAPRSRSAVRDRRPAPEETADRVSRSPARGVNVAGPIQYRSRQPRDGAVRAPKSGVAKPGARRSIDPRMGDLFEAMAGKGAEEKV